MKKNPGFYFAIFALGLSLSAQTASAAIVEVSFAGVVTDNNPLLGDPVVGSPVEGTFTMGPANPSGVGPSCFGEPNCWSGPDYTWTWNGADATMGLLSITVTIEDVAAGTGADTYEVVMFGFDSFVTAKLMLSDSSGTAFESAGDSLMPQFDLFDSRTFSFVPLCLTSISCIENRYYFGDLTALEFPAVPLPAAAWLLGSALLTLGALSRRRRPDSDKHN